MASNFAEFVERLADRLRGPLPGLEAVLHMAPHVRRDMNLLRVDGKACREGAVLVLVYPLENDPATVLTVRRDNLSAHAGQVAFPGGRREPGEPLVHTALREAHEEVGLPLADEVRVLGRLTPFYIPPSNFCVYPFVATLPYRPTFRPNAGEVKAILEVPIAHFLDPKTRREEIRVLQGTPAPVPYYAVGEHKVWGGTAMMLAELTLVVGPLVAHME
ncbi:MAG: CoA pyrophosphatase [Ardenticatenia bacterium]|nr:CoA pyrophosphatase [Ardenticatenia bacterium]